MTAIMGKTHRAVILILVLTLKDELIFNSIQAYKQKIVFWVE